MKRIKCLYLDILSIPGLFMSKKGNAQWHLKRICPICPKWRKELRAINSKNCWWESNWKIENYNIPKTFGIVNKLSQYFFLKTNLSKFK